MLGIQAIDCDTFLSSPEASLSATVTLNARERAKLATDGSIYKVDTGSKTYEVVETEHSGQIRA